MKKVLAILLALAMIAVFVPAFAVSADGEDAVTAPTLEEAIAGKEKLTPYSDSKNTISEFASVTKGAQIGSFGCGFLDGNVFFDQVNAKTLMSALADEDVLVYVDGKLAEMAPNHAGILSHRGLGGGYQLSIYKAGFKTGVKSTVTIVFGHGESSTGLYTEFDVTPTADSLYYEDADVVIKGVAATITVNGGDVATYYADKVGTTVKARVHDDHADRTLTVESVKDGTVVFTCDNFSKTTHQLLEVAYGTEGAFGALIDTNLPGGSIPAPAEGEAFSVAVQTKQGTNTGNDIRFVLSAAIDNIANLQSAKVTVTFKSGSTDIKSLTVNYSNMEYFKQVVADGEYWSPETGYALSGFVITDVPTFAWTACELTIVDGEDTLYTGTVANDGKIQFALVNGLLGGAELITGATDIHAGPNDENYNQADREGNGEGIAKAFDGDAGSKFGAGAGEGQQGTMQITWKYDTAKTVDYYCIITGNDVDRWGGNARMPLGWTLYGSNDGTTWTVIDTVAEANLPIKNKYPSYHSVISPAAYTNYKLVVKANAGQYLEICEIKMFALTENATSYSFNSTITGAKDFSSSNYNTWNVNTENVAQLFDGDIYTKMGGGFNNNNVTVSWSYDKEHTAKGYAVQTANDSLGSNRTPKGWKLYGSTDGTDYVVIDTVTGINVNMNWEYMLFEIDNPGAYQYYKIEFDMTGCGAFQLSEFALIN